MAAPLASLLSGISDKIGRIAASVKLRDDRIAQLEKENQDLRHEMELLKDELEKQRLDSQFLTMSHRLADNPDTLVETRRHIARLIRNIDRALHMMRDL